MDLTTEFNKLQKLQESLLTAFHSISPFNSNIEENRLSIINDTYKFQEILKFIETELGFQYNYPDETTEGIEDIFQFDKYSEFLMNFKKNFSALQFKLRDGIKESFQQAKEAKYKVNKKQSNEHTLSQIKKEEESSNKSINDKVVSANKRITSKLQESSSILQSTLLQSQLNLDDLTIQDQTLSELSDKYTSLKGILNKSDEFVKNIKLSNARDKQRMYYSLIFFALCCAKVVWSRLLKFPYAILKYIIWSIFWTIGLIKSKEIGDSSVTIISSVSSSSFPTTTTTATVIDIVTKESYHPDIEMIIQSNTLDETTEEGFVVSIDEASKETTDLSYLEKHHEAESTTTDTTAAANDLYEEKLARIIDEL